MTAVLRTYPEDFGPRDEIRGFRPTLLTNRRWFLGRDTWKVYAASLLDEALDPAQSSELDQEPLAAVVAPLVPGDTSGSHLIHVLGADGMVTTLSTTTLAAIGAWTATGEAQTVGALAVGGYGLYVGGLGGVKAYNQETGQAAWAKAAGLGWVKWLAVCRDTPDVIYAIDEQGRWAVFACDGVTIWGVPTAALDPIPDIVDVRTDTDYATSAASTLAVLSKGPAGVGQVTFIDLATPQEPVVSSVANTYAVYTQTGITGAAATDRPVTEADAGEYPELPWWHPVAFAALRSPTIDQPLDGLVALDGQRRAWLTTEPTSPPAGESPYAAPSQDTPGPSCSLVVSETETVAATVLGACSWLTSRDARPGSGVVTGGSASVDVAAPGNATIPLSVGTNNLLLTVTDAKGKTATATDSVLRRAVNPFTLPSLSLVPLTPYVSMLGNRYGKDFLTKYRKGTATVSTGAGWKMLFLNNSAIFPAILDTATSAADFAAYEVSGTGGNYPVGGIPIADMAVRWAPSGFYLEAANQVLNITLPSGASGDLAKIVFLSPAGEVVAENQDPFRIKYGGSVITDLFGADAGDLFFAEPLAMLVFSYDDPTVVSNSRDFDATPPVFVARLLDAGAGVIRSVPVPATLTAQSAASGYRTLFNRYETGAVSIPLYTTDPTPAWLEIISTTHPLGVATDYVVEQLFLPTYGTPNPATYTSVTTPNVAIDLVLPGIYP